MRIRLFCLPYVGGGAVLFHSWRRRLPAGVAVCPVELPGRGARFSERPFDRLQPLVQSLARGLSPYLDAPFALFGHSMGALIAYELCHVLQQQRGELPVQLFVAGRCAPSVPPSSTPIHALPDIEFLLALRKLNGTPDALLDNADLMALTLPVLRADFAVCETHEYEVRAPLTYPIAVVCGVNDKDVSANKLEPWAKETSARCVMHCLLGDHFFLHQSEALVLHLIARYLRPCVLGAA